MAKTSFRETPYSSAAVSATEERVAAAAEVATQATPSRVAAAEVATQATPLSVAAAEVATQATPPSVAAAEVATQAPQPSVAAAAEVPAPRMVNVQWVMGQAQEVVVTGEMLGWHVRLPMVKLHDGTFTGQLPHPQRLPCPYKFIVDGVWKHSPFQPTENDNHGGLNNVLEY